MRKNINENALNDILVDVADELRGIKPELEEVDSGLADDLEQAIDVIEGDGDAENGWAIADNVANSVADIDVDLANEIWDAIAILKQLSESKKREVIGKVSIKEAKRALKENDDDDNAKYCLNALKSYLDYYKYDYDVTKEGDEIELDVDNDEIRMLAFDVAKEFNNVCQPYFGQRRDSGKYYVGFQADHSFWNNEDTSDGLTDEMKSVIEDMAAADYESGHPLSREDALDWFQSGEEEDIPVELASEAADYYFEAFDQDREEDNNQDWFDEGYEDDE